MFCIGDFEFGPIALGLALAPLCFVVQLVLCLRVRHRFLRHIPLWLMGAILGLAGLTATGIFGEGSGFVGNMHLLLAAVLAIVAAFGTIGVGSAWLLYFLLERRK